MPPATTTLPTADDKLPDEIALSPLIAAAADSLHVSRIAGVIKAFRGDIWGEYATRGMILGCLAGIKTMECRVPPEAISFFVPVLRQDYGVTIDDSPEVGIHKYVVWVPAIPEARPLHLRVRPILRKPWRTDGVVAFDIDALAVDANSMFLRAPLTAFRCIDDRMSFIVERVRTGCFCLMASLPSPGAVMRQALSMVTNGAVMDDAIHGRTAWVAARWETLVRNPGSVRRIRAPSPSCFAFTSSSLPLPAKHDTCPLCHESFALDDLVINLGCNHNFHGSCSTNSNGGICTWMDAHNTCPCCRVAITV